MKTLSKALLVPAVVAFMLAGAVAARADRDDYYHYNYHRAHVVHHYHRLDAYGERLVARGAYLKRHGHLARGRHLERLGAHLDHSADRWMNHHHVRDTQ